MESNEKDQLRSLIRLAREKARENRRILRDNISDLFLSAAGRLSEQESALIAEVLRLLVHDLEMALRRELADRLPRVDNQPRALASSLTDEDTEMAHAALMRHEVLRDSDLIELAKHRAAEYLLAEARGSSGGDASILGPNEASRGGEAPLLESLVNSPDPVLALRTRDYLVAETRRVDKFRRPILAACELPAALRRKLVWWIAAALQQYVAQRMPAETEIDAALLDDIMEDSARAAFAVIEGESAKADVTDKLIERLVETGELSTDFLVQALNQGLTALFVTGLAKRCYLKQKTARRIVFDTSGEALALACKAMGFTREEFELTFTLTRLPGVSGRSSSITKELLKLYDAVNEKTARRSLAYWGRNTEYTAAVEQVKK